MSRDSAPDEDCPCGSGSAYASCCAPFHRGAPAPSAEALMRSRYSAYARQLPDYLLATWHRSTRPAAVEVGSPGSTLRWLGLKVLGHEVVDDEHALVEFVARYRSGGSSATRLHEVSRFVREGGRWYYVDGDITER